MQRTEDVAVQKWITLQQHFNHWFHQPDLVALQIVLAAFHAHYQLEADPVWPIVVGPSGTGKTEICVNPFYDLPDTHPQGDISPKAFIAGRGGKAGSLLRRIGPHGIMLFKDFGTIMSKREHDRLEVASHLREIFDGSFGRQVGGGGLPLWKGKITVIGAATPAIDRAWGVMQELGDRFVFVRWGRGDGFGMGRAARRQIGHEKEIREGAKAVVRDFLKDVATEAPRSPCDELEDILINLAEMTAWLRRKVTRDNPDGHRAIIDIPEAEGPGRLMKAMSMLSSHRASLFGRSAPTNEDLNVARRIAFDSVPASRMKFINAIPLGSDATFADVIKLSGTPKGSMNWLADELVALGVIGKWEEGEISYRFTDEFAAILKGTRTRSE